MNKALEMKKIPPFKRTKPCFEETRTVWIAGRYDRPLSTVERPKNLPPNTVVDVLVNGVVSETIFMKGSRKGLPRKLKMIRDHRKRLGEEVEFRVYAVDRVDLRMRKITVQETR